MEMIVIRGEIQDWMKGDGSGSGDGDGSGYGDGSGSGDGDGSGYGYGSGSGSGSGYGDGYGNGYGSGSGSGSGYGYGSGYGDGDGYGYGSGDEYRLATIPCLSTRWPDAQQKRLEEAKKEGATLAFWRSNLDGTPANGGQGGARKAGDVEKIPGPLELCGARALHATTKVSVWKGAKVWVVALFGEIARSENGDKLGALHREILGEAWCEE